MNFKKFFITAAATLGYINASADFTVGDFTYGINGSQVYISASTIDAGDLVIPDTVVNEGKTYKVYSVSADVFRDKTGITSVTFGKNITMTGNYAFAGCTGLSKLVLGPAMTKTGQYAFKDCRNITSVTVDTSMAEFGYAAFEGCLSLDSVVFMGDINQWAQINVEKSNQLANPLYTAHNLYIADTLVTNLTGLTVSDIAPYAFNGATCLQGDMVIAKSIKTIGTGAFNGCTGITGVYYEGSLSDWLQSTLGSSILRTAPKLYIDGKLLTSLEIPSDVTSIPNYAFYGLTSLTGEIDIPQNIASIGSSAFAGCTGITSVVIGDGTQTLGSNCFQGCSSLESVVIGDQVQKIDIYTFQNCSALNYVKIGNAVKSIGYEAFKGCPLQCELPLPASLTEIGDYAFQNCSGLYGPLNLPQGLISIGSYAFGGCSSLSALVLPQSLTTVKSGAFSGCSAISGEVIIPQSITAIPSYMFQNCTNLTAILLHDGITSIDTYAFSGCSGLTGKMTLPPDIKSIQSNTFYKCSGLSEIVIPDGVTSIGYMAFSDCTSLSGTLTLPQSVTNIGNYAFSSCLSLESVVFGDNVTIIGQSAFYGCKGLKGTVILPPDITTVYEYTFWMCSGLESVVIGDKVTTIGRYAFSDCTSLAGTVKIPNSVTAIGTNAFSGCENIESFILGDGLQQLYDYSLACKGLKMILTENTTPPLCNSSSVFTGVDRSIPIYVPTGTVDAYATAAIWEEFQNIAADPNFVTDIQIYMDGRLVEETVEVAQKRQFSLTADVTPQDASIKTVKWNVDNTAAVNLQRREDNRVDVTPLEIGTYTLTATAADGSGTSRSIVLEVSYVGVTGIRLDIASTVLHANETFQLTAQVFPDDASMPDVVWSSGDPTVAQVDSQGLVTALKSGETTVTAISLADPQLEASCTISVVPYNITFWAEGDIFKTMQYDPGETITPPDQPVKTGYTFVGWDGLPDVMPPNDLDVTALFSINTYKITYIVDDEEYLSETYPFGSEITPPPFPEKIGHTFGGWHDIPDAMPALDIEIMGYFNVNSYIVTFYIDGQIHSTASVEFGATIPIPSVTPPEGRIFDRWITEIPASMPPENLEIHGVTSPLSAQTLIWEDSDSKADIYNLSGIKVLTGATIEEARSKLSPGIYILRQGTTSRKILIQ